ncbi:MAG: hypothetical protein ACE5G6_07285 [Terriglobia bacterium]
MGEVLTRFFRLVDHAPPRMGIECNNLVRPADFALEDFKREHPGQFPQVVYELGTAMLAYDHGCRALGRGAPATWKRAADHVYRAEELFRQALGVKTDTGPNPANPVPPPGDQTGPPESNQPRENSPPRSEEEAAKRSVSSPGPGDPETVEKASKVLESVQKLASTLDLGLGKKEVQDRLIDAHAALEDFSSHPLSENVPLTVGSLRVALAYLRRALDGKDAFAMLSGKDSLQRAREYLRNYETTGQEQAGER